MGGFVCFVFLCEDRNRSIKYKYDADICASTIGFMHWFWVGDMFAPLKRKCPFIMTLIAIFGRVVRYSFVLIFLFLAIYVLLQDSLQILITLYFGMVGLYFLFLILSALRIKIRCIKNKEPYPIAIGYKNISSDIKIYHFILGFILLLLIFPLTFFPDED